jgi:type I restriction enzyme, S subunit
MTSCENLKPGWKSWRFDQIAINVNERIDDPSKSGVEFYVGLEHLDPDSLKIRRWGKPEDVEATKLCFKKGDIIFARRRAYQRKLGVAEFDGICSAHAMVLRPRTDVVLPEFLPFFMQSDLFMNRAVEISVGSLSPTINWKTMAVQQFVLPPLEEQRLILQILEAIENHIECLSSAVVAGEKLYASILLDSFQNLDHYKKRRVDDCYEIQLGKMSSEKARTGGNPQTYIKNNNVLWGRFDFTELPQMSFDEREIRKYELRIGDLLVCEGGEIGRAAIWQDDISGMLYQKALHRLRPRTKSDITLFMFHYLRYCANRGILDGVATGTTIRHLPVEQLSQLSLPFPPKNIQERIAGILSGIADGNTSLNIRVKTAMRLKSMALNIENNAVINK